MTARAGTPFLDALRSELPRADDDSKREIADQLRPYLLDDPGRLLSASEKAEQLGVHPDTIAKWARDGRIWAVKVGKAWRFRADRSEIQRAAGSRTSVLRFHHVAAATGASNCSGLGRGDSRSCSGTGAPEAPTRRRPVMTGRPAPPGDESSAPTDSGSGSRPAPLEID